MTKWCDCYAKDVSSSFDTTGWSTCDNGYFMAGMYRSAGNYLYNIEYFECCHAWN